MTNIFRQPIFSNSVNRAFVIPDSNNVVYYTTPSVNPFYNYDQPNPVSKRYTLSENESIGYFTSVIVNPFQNYDQPNPTGYRSNDLKTWTVFNPNLSPPPVIVQDSTHILRSPNFTRNVVRYVDLNQQFINTVVLATVSTPVDTTHILRSPVFTKFEIKQVDVKQLTPNLLTTTLGFIGPKPFNLNEWPNTLPKVIREFGYVRSSFLIGGIPPTPLATLFAGRVVTIDEWDEEGVIHARPYREGMKQVIIREAAKALGRQGGIASGKTRRRG